MAKIHLDIQALCDLYNEGATLEDLAERYVVSTWVIRNRLLAAGVPIRPAHRRRISNDTISSILVLTAQGLTHKKIAEQLDIHETTVFRYIQKWKALKESERESSGS